MKTKLIDYWNSHGTKILGTLASIVSGLLLVPGFIPVHQMKFWQAASVVLGVITVKRGFTNSSDKQ